MKKAPFSLGSQYDTPLGRVRLTLVETSFRDWNHQGNVTLDFVDVPGQAIVPLHVFVSWMPDVPEHTQDEMKTALIELKNYAGDKAEAMAILKQFGYSNIMEVKPKDLDSVYDAAVAKLADLQHAEEGKLYINYRADRGKFIDQFGKSVLQEICRRHAIPYIRETSEKRPRWEMEKLMDLMRQHREVVKAKDSLTVNISVDVSDLEKRVQWMLDHKEEIQNLLAREIRDAGIADILQERCRHSLYIVEGNFPNTYNEFRERYFNPHGQKRSNWDAAFRRPPSVDGARVDKPFNAPVGRLMFPSLAKFWDQPCRYKMYYTDERKEKPFSVYHAVTRRYYTRLKETLNLPPTTRLRELSAHPQVRTASAMVLQEIIEDLLK